MRSVFSIFVAFIAFILCVSSQNLDSVPPSVREVVRQIDQRTNKQFFDYKTPWDLHSEYDFIVVGSGPAGSVITNRLTENPNTRVLLIEAGPRPITLQSIPAFAQFADIPGYNWNYGVNPYPGACLALNGQTCGYPLGKMLGGSSSLNYLMYVRGNAADYNRWHEMGNYGWSYDDVLPLFRKFERALLVHEEDPSHRGLNGELGISHSAYQSDLLKSFVDASTERGMSFQDYNGPSQIAVDHAQATVYKGKRMSATRAFLDPIMNRKNLHVMINSLVSKVIIDPVSKIAQGVEFNYQGKTYTVRAKKEVILSAGPINSPMLLMLSGIGPKEDLEPLDIQVIADLPVGHNYSDHISLPGILYTVDDSEENIHLLDITQEDINDFIDHGKGKLTVPSAIEGISMYHLGISEKPRYNPEIEFMFSAGRNELGFSGFTTYRNDLYQAAFRANQNPNVKVISFLMMNLYPESRGKISLRGNSINYPPILSFPFLKSERDMQVFLMGINETIALSKTEAFQEKNAKLLKLPIPECENYPYPGESYWRCFIRQMARNNCHIVGSAKMGPANDSQAVVDPELRVKGIRRLRVADSSIMPTLIAGHNQAAAYLIGEKMAEILQVTWNL